MPDSDSKRLRLVARRCLERLGILEQRVYVDNPKVVEEKRHLTQGSSERGYYLAGYMQALKDIRGLISKGAFPDNAIETGSCPLNSLSDHSEVSAVTQMCLSCSVKEAAPCIGIVPLCLDCSSKLSNNRGVTYVQPDPDRA